MGFHQIRIVTTRAPGLIPCLIDEIGKAEHPVVLIPESFTLAVETEIVGRSREQGIFDLLIFSPSSLIREVRELTGYGRKKPVSGDGQNMVVSRVLHENREQLQYYRESVAQPTLAQKIAGQIDDFTRARLSPDFLREYRPSSRRTARKMADLALVWEEYARELEKGYEDTVGQWMSAVGRIRESGLIRGVPLLIFGFDYITHDILNLVRSALEPGGASEIVIGLISDDVGPDRDIFRAANDSVKELEYYLEKSRIRYVHQQYTKLPAMDPGIAYVEKTIYATGAFADKKVYLKSRGRDVPPEENVIREDARAAQQYAQEALRKTPAPDLSHVHTYYAKNSYLECQHACQTLIGWHRSGIPWEEMAVAVCEQGTLPSLLPLTLAAAGIPFNAKQDQPILMSAYAQYVLSLLRILRLGFRRRDVVRMIKTGFTPLTPAQVMDMENYAREHGIDRSAWKKPFYLPEKEEERAKTEALEALRKSLIEPVERLEEQLRKCKGREAATRLFGFITEAGIYERLLEQEEAFAARGDDLAIDRNRQVWTAVNELLDAVATFYGEAELKIHDLCTMLEASLAAATIKSLPQQSRAVTVAPPQMFFSSGIRCMIVMGLQENEISTGAGVLSEVERGQLEAYIEESNRDFYLNRGEPMTAGAEESEAGTEEARTAKSAGPVIRPFSKIGQSLQDLAARQKQDVYQAVSLAREELMLSCSSARPSGGVLTPSTAFRRLADTLQVTNPENATGGLMETDIRPFAPAFALEALAVRLREKRDGNGCSPEENDPEDARWMSALATLYRSETWHGRTQGVLDGLHVTLPAEGLVPEVAERLYSTHAFSISRVETFASCPWRHLLQYGLELFPEGAFTFRADEQGTFNHDVIQRFLDAAMKLPEWPDLSEEQTNRLLNGILRERAKKWEGGVLRADTVNRYQGAAIIHGVRTSVASLMRAFRQKPHFLPMAAEVPFGTRDPGSPLNLPAVQIRTADGETVAFTGRIDRIDRLDLPDGRRYFMIVDHKMSARDVRQNSLMAGLQLQLPLYIHAARRGLTGLEAAGALYQPVKDVLIGNDDPGQIAEKIDRELQTSGIILDDKAVQEAAKPVKIARRSETNDTVSAVTAEGMLDLEAAAYGRAAEIVNRIRAGETAPAPVKDGPESPCFYCDHESGCPYDRTMPGYRIPEVDHKHRREMTPRPDGLKA